MTLRTKLPLFSSLILFITILTLSVLFRYNYKRTINDYLEQYRQEQINGVISHLKDIINIAYRMIDASYTISQKTIKKYSGIKLDTIPESIAKMIQINMLKISLNQLRSIRYGKDGYIWINEFDPPYTVIMHATRPELEGKSWNFYIEGTNINVYKAFHDSIIVGGGEGRVSYSFYKPGTNEKVPKISWVKLYKPLRWVIGTGVYVDEIDKMIKAKEKVLEDSIQKMTYTIFLISLVMLLLSVAVLYFPARSITVPIFKVQRVLEELSKGKIINPTHIKRKDEIGTMSSALEKVIEGLKTYTKFAQRIGHGDFDVDFEPLSEEDVLGNELLIMKRRLLEAREKEKKQLEIEKKRHWVSDSFSEINELITGISKEEGDLKKRLDEILIRLMEKVEAALGAIFLLRFEDDDVNKPYLLQFSTVAYGSKKLIKNKLDPNEGLVGACFMEREPIYITKVPENYVQIKTGLIEAIPRNIYLTPLIYEVKPFGVIELAAYSKFDNFDRELIDNVARSLAVALSIHQYYYEKDFNVEEWALKYL